MQIASVFPQEDVRHAEEDLQAASHHCIAHGSLLSLRYVLSEVSWAAILGQHSSRDSNTDYRPAFKAALSRVFSIVSRVACVTLPVLALYQDTYLGDDASLCAIKQQLVA